MFARWLKKASIDSDDLIVAFEQIKTGASSAKLAKNLFKVRVKRKHGGKRSGYRTIVAYKEGSRCVYLYGFAKNDRENISLQELYFLKTIGNQYVNLNGEEMKKALLNEKLFLIGEEE